MGGSDISLITMVILMAAVVAGAVVGRLFWRWYQVYRRNGRK